MKCNPTLLTSSLQMFFLQVYSVGEIVLFVNMITYVCIHFWLTVKYSWGKSDGTVLATAKRLSVCAQCLLERYCSERCQRMHLATHGLGCQQATKYLPAATVDAMVQRVCKPEPGRTIVLRYDLGDNVTRIEDLPGEATPNDRMRVLFHLNDHPPRTHNYLLCHRVEGGVSGIDSKEGSQPFLDRPLLVVVPGLSSLQS